MILICPFYTILLYDTFTFFYMNTETNLIKRLKTTLLRYEPESNVREMRIF
jgi:hypothetical protein